MLADNIEIQINQPLTIIKLQMSCSAQNQEITLLLNVTMQSTVHPKAEPFFALRQESNFPKVQIWQPFIHFS